MRRGLGCMLVLAAAASLAHEADFPLPLLASGATTTAVAAEAAATSAPSLRPRQAPGLTLPLRPTRRIAFDTDEGTWLSVDVAPDGSRLVFDLLGDIYSLATGGGRATAITHGLGFDAQPTYSPDGQWIAFLSDRSGADNLWVMRPDGSQARQVSFGGDDTVLVSPAWSPDGQSLYVSRFLWSLNNYELWRYGLDGSETLIAPIKAPEQPRSSAISSLGAVVAPDGRSIYFARRTGDADEGHWSVVRRDLADGHETTVLPDPAGPGRPSNAGKYFRPALSPDGRLLAYATRFGGQTGLRVRDLATGADRWVAFPIERDQVGAESWQDLVPRYAFTRDGKALILSRHGKLERLAIDAGAATSIPFTASVDLQLGPLTRVDVKQETGPVRARLIQTPEQSPDGRRLVFSALGKIYLQPLDGHSKPRRLTASRVGVIATDPATAAGEPGEFHPSWSPDGKLVTYVTWSAREAGKVWVASTDSGTPRLISDSAAYYTRPVFTPDGSHILAVRSSQRGRLETVMDIGEVRSAELVEWPASGGPARVIYSGKLGGKLHFAAAANTVYLRDEDGLVAVDLSAGTLKVAAKVVGPGWYFMDHPAAVDDLRISPDGQWLLVQIAQQLHVLAMPASAQTVDLSNPGLAHRRITNTGVDFFEWADGGKTITWSLGSTFQRRALADIELNAPDHPNWSADVQTVAHGRNAFDAVVEVPRDVPRGNVLLRGARVITMRGNEVIENADLLVSDNRIAAVGPRDTLKLPVGTQVRDLSGKVILPGFIDIHDHVADIRRDILATDAWGLRARLAYGITTSFDPSTLSIDMFAYQDMVDAGMVLGARVPSTGMALFSFNRLASLEDALALLTRNRDYYRTHNAKQYLIGNRRQRQWLVQAAAQLGVMPTTEGSSALKLDLTQIMDGFSGNEHALPTPLYRDVIELVARSGTSYDATLQIENGGPPAQNQFIVRDRPLEDAKFMRTRPYLTAIASIEQRSLWTDPEMLLYPRIGGDVGRIQRAGGVTGIGSHGEVPGTGFHWELAAHAQGGMPPWDVLRAGTIGSATAIGRGKEFGSIEPGKYADLVILNSDPRDDIRNSHDIAQVMKNGRLYDAATLDELWPRQRQAPAQWFDEQQPSAR